MERPDPRFTCTKCGKCCYGWLPLTLNDALSHTTRFPLAMVWTAVPQGAKVFPLTTRLGISIRLAKRRQISALIAPTAYLPPAFPCPELSTEGLCAIQAHKPLRCRTMPFYAYRDEADQAELLVPRQGWACDTSITAPIVYHNKRVVERDSFDLERQDLLEQALMMSAYAEYVMKYMPWIVDSLAAAAQNPGSNVITSLSSFLVAIKQFDVQTIAAQQLPLLKAYAARTSSDAELVEYYRNYTGWAKEMEYLVGAALQA